MQHVALRARGRSVGRVPTISFFASFAAPEAGSETALAISRLSWSLLVSLSSPSLSPLFWLLFLGLLFSRFWGAILSLPFCPSFLRSLTHTFIL